MTHYQERVIERLREQLSNERSRRQDELREMSASHEQTIALAETRRLDAIQLAEQRRIDSNRAADAAATVLANTRAELTAATLAERVDTSAKTLSSQVEATKTAAAIATDATSVALGGRIKSLEDARYEQAGRSKGMTETTKVVWAILVVVLGLGVTIVLRITT